MVRLILGSAIAAAVALAMPAAKAATYTTVQQTISITTNNGAADANVQCPAGYRPVGGGWRQGTPNAVSVDVYFSTPGVPFAANIPRFIPVGSFPDGQGWHTAGYTVGTISVVFYAVCATG